MADVNVWKVVYDVRFESSSSATGKYHLDNKMVVGLLLTNGGSISEVESQLNERLLQGRVMKIHSAEWLGLATMPREVR